MSDPPTAEDPGRLCRLARHLAVFEAPDFSFGSWVPSRTGADGVITLGWFEPSKAARAFLSDAGAFVAPFDWPTWSQTERGQALLGDPEAVASASEEELGWLLTALVRAERFGEGTLESASRRGTLMAVLRRADHLCQHRPAAEA